MSGSAYKLLDDRALHHGTLLLRVDPSAMLKYLTPDKQKLQAKGVSSVAARVLNLADVVPALDHATMGRRLMGAFKDHYKSDCEVRTLRRVQVALTLKVEQLSKVDLLKIPNVASAVEMLQVRSLFRLLFNHSAFILVTNEPRGQELGLRPHAAIHAQDGGPF